MDYSGDVRRIEAGGQAARRPRTGVVGRGEARPRSIKGKAGRGETGRTGTMVRIKLPDGSVKEYPEGVRPREVAEGIGKRLADAAVAAVANGTVVDLDRPIEDGTGEAVELRLLTPRDREALDVLRHSTAHIMARAILRLFPGARLAFGPTTTCSEFSTRRLYS